MKFIIGEGLLLSFKPTHGKPTQTAKHESLTAKELDEMLMRYFFKQPPNNFAQH